MSFAEAITIVTMPHLPCTFENVISVAKAAKEENNLGPISPKERAAMESLVDAIHDLQEAAANVTVTTTTKTISDDDDGDGSSDRADDGEDSGNLLAQLSKVVGKGDTTYREVKQQLHKLWSPATFSVLKSNITAFLQARSRVLFHGNEGPYRPQSLSRVLSTDVASALANAANRRGSSSSNHVQNNPPSTGTSAINEVQNKGDTFTTKESKAPVTQQLQTSKVPATGGFDDGPSKSRLLKGRLILKIVAAQDLQPMDSNGKSDPYCIMSLELPTSTPKQRQSVRISRTNNGLASAQSASFPDNRSNNNMRRNISNSTNTNDPTQTPPPSMTASTFPEDDDGRRDSVGLDEMGLPVAYVFPSFLCGDTDCMVVVTVATLRVWLVVGWVEFSHCVLHRLF